MRHGPQSLLALLFLATPVGAQSGGAAGTCVISILDEQTPVPRKGNLSVGQCFGPGQDILSPPRTMVTVVTPLKDTISINGRLTIREQGTSGQSFWVRNGTAFFRVVTKKLSFFNVEGQSGNRTFQAAVRGTSFRVDVAVHKSLTLTPVDGEIRVTRAVKLDVKGTGPAEGQRAISAAGSGAPRAAQALLPNRSDMLEGAYSRKSESVSAGSNPLVYALDGDEVVKFDSVSECIAFYSRALDPDAADGYLNLGDCYLEGDDARNAAANYSKALTIDLRRHPSGIDPDIADDYRSLAEAYYFTDLRQAIASVQKALAIDTQVYGNAPDPDVAEDHRTLADLYLLLDEPTKAIAELELALRIDQLLYPDGLDFDLAEDYRSLGEGHILAGTAAGASGSHVAAAIAALQQALVIDKTLLGEDVDPDLAQDHRSLGFAYLLKDDQARAFTAFHNAFRIGLQLLDIEASSDPATIDFGGLDLDSDEVDVDDLVDLHDDAMELSQIARDGNREAEASAFAQVATRIAAKLKGT